MPAPSPPPSHAQLGGLGSQGHPSRHTPQGHNSLAGLTGGSGGGGQLGLQGSGSVGQGVVGVAGSVGGGLGLQVLSSGNVQGRQAIGGASNATLQQLQQLQQLEQMQQMERLQQLQQLQQLRYGGSAGVDAAEASGACHRGEGLGAHGAAQQLGGQLQQLPIQLDVSLGGGGGATLQLLQHQHQHQHQHVQEEAAARQQQLLHQQLQQLTGGSGLNLPGGGPSYLLRQGTGASGSGGSTFLGASLASSQLHGSSLGQSISLGPGLALSSSGLAGALAGGDIEATLRAIRSGEGGGGGGGAAPSSQLQISGLGQAGMDSVGQQGPASAWQLGGAGLSVGSGSLSLQGHGGLGSGAGTRMGQDGGVWGASGQGLGGLEALRRDEQLQQGHHGGSRDVQNVLVLQHQFEGQQQQQQQLQHLQQLQQLQQFQQQQQQQHPSGGLSAADIQARVNAGGYGGVGGGLGGMQGSGDGMDGGHGGWAGDGEEAERHKRQRT